MRSQKEVGRISFLFHPYHTPNRADLRLQPSAPIAAASPHAPETTRDADKHPVAPRTVTKVNHDGALRDPQSIPSTTEPTRSQTPPSRSNVTTTRNPPTILGFRYNTFTFRWLVCLI
ncbi:unnamed protein product [Vicia faba]|uniref:Uncharacterized protein n=1 Tax=Vicia faba TaxID=3906 RepID=A0AAV0ZLD8_VICFA|nr:unnamed protein product [Vicia faba]